MLHGERFAPQHHQQILDTQQKGNSGMGQLECRGAPFLATNSGHRLGEGHHAITNVFPPSSASSHHHEVTNFSWSTHRSPRLPESELVSIAELVRVIRRLWVVAALGSHGISVLCLRKCMMALLPWILSLRNASLSFAYFPKAWRRTKVIALRKPRKDSYDAPEPTNPSAFFLVCGRFWKRR